MSERKKMEELYNKVKAKYPHITDKEEIDKLVAVFQKKKLLLKSLSFLGCGAIFLLILALLIYFEKAYEGTKALLLIGGVSLVVESIRNFVKCLKVDNKKIEKDIDPTEIEIIDTAHVLSKYKNKLRDFSQFTVLKECLFDKTDEMEVGISNNLWHEYELIFKDSKTEETYRFGATKSEYDAAFIGKEYYLIVTPFGDELINRVVGIYDTVNYQLHPDMAQYCQFDIK